MLARSILSVFLIAQAVQSSPLMEKRTEEISCNPAKVNATEITLQLSPQGSLSPYPLYEKVSAKGQHQIAISNDKNSTTLSVIMRQCNSTRLGLSYSERYDPNSVNPVKLYLANDESKCIQRHGQIHSNDQTAKTHIIIDDCSNLDNQYQAKQFWSVYEPYALIYPLVVRNGKEDSLQLVLSGQDSGEVLATGQVPDGQNSYAFGFPQ